MILKSGILVKDSNIDYIRVIEDLPQEYSRNAYPIYSLILMNRLFNLEKEECTGLLMRLNNLKTIAYKTPSSAMLGYPSKTEIIVHVNIGNIAYVNCSDDIEFLYRIKFTSGAELYSYNKDTINIISKWL